MSIHNDPNKPLYGEEMATSMSRALPAMTDPLIEVAEQMERFADSGAGHLTPSAVGQIAARIRAFWTPQRKAFYEAAMEFQRRWNLKQEIMTSEDLEAHQRFDDAYLALVESERGESEGR